TRVPLESRRMAAQRVLRGRGAGGAMATQVDNRSREVAEAARETKWKGASFLRELFLGAFHPDRVHPYPESGAPRPEFQRFYDELRDFLVRRVDPVSIDDTGEYPRDVIDGLAALGAFGMKIPVAYGGLGL